MMKKSEACSELRSRAEQILDERGGKGEISDADHLSLIQELEVHQIGRASCRERV